MKQKTSNETENGDNSFVFVICFVAVVFVGGMIGVSFLDHEQQKTVAAPAKHDNITTEIPVQRIRCVKPGHNYCMEYRVFNEVKQ